MMDECLECRCQVLKWPSNHPEIFQQQKRNAEKTKHSARCWLLLTWAGVVKPASFRALFWIGPSRNLHTKRMDLVNAFLYGLLDEIVYVEQPQRYLQGSLVCSWKWRYQLAFQKSAKRGNYGPTRQNTWDRHRPSPKRLFGSDHSLKRLERPISIQAPQNFTPAAPIYSYHAGSYHQLWRPMHRSTSKKYLLAYARSKHSDI